jgi:receptor protein-tyrosine kinase
MSAQLYSGSAPGASITVRTASDRASPTQRVPTQLPSARPCQRLSIAHTPFDSRGEELRALRSELLLRREFQDRAEVIALLSPRAGEGRSQLSAELAIAFAQLGRPTLLVDADLRNPRQHTLFGADNRLGLAHALATGVAPQLHAVEDLPQLSLVTAGAVPPNPLELLLHGRFSSLLDEWRQSFEFIVLDTSPVTPFSDALAVAHVAGRVLALTRAHQTPYQDTRGMFRRLAATRAQVLGAVISHF